MKNAQHTSQQIPTAPPPTHGPTAAMVASIPYRHGSHTPIDMTYAADAAAARPGVPQGKVSAVTAKKMRRAIREKKKAEKEMAKEAVKAEAAAAAGVKFVEEILVVNDLKVRRAADRRRCLLLLPTLSRHSPTKKMPRHGKSPTTRLRKAAHSIPVPLVQTINSIDQTKRQTFIFLFCLPFC